MREFWSGLGRLPRRLWIVAVGTFINRAGTMALPFFPLYLTRVRGVEAARAGTFLALYGAAALSASPLSGRLCDRWSAKSVMCASLGFSAVAMVLLPATGSFASLALLTAAWGLASEAYRPAEMIAVSECVPPGSSRKAFALSRLAANLGMGVGPAVGGFLAEHSLRSVWMVDAMTSIAAFGFLTLALPSSPSFGEGRPPLANTSLPPSALGDARLRGLLLAVFAVGLVLFQHNSALPIFLVRGLGLKASTYGLLFTVNSVMIATLELPLAHACSGFSHRAVLCAGALLFGLGFGAYAVAAGTAGALAATAVWTFGEMLFLPTAAAYVSEIAPPERRGDYMGLFTMAMSVSFMVGPFLGLWILGLLGSGALWTGALALGAASALAAARLPQEPASAPKC